jgi:hypothetical protein
MLENNAKTGSEIGGLAEHLRKLLLRYYIGLIPSICL